MPGLPLHTLTDVWLNTVNKFSRKVWPRLSNFLVTRYFYVVFLEPITI